MKKKYTGPERRQFLRLAYSVPLAYKVCKRKTVSKLLRGYTSNISQSGLLCNIKERIGVGDILWLSFEHSTLTICQEIEKEVLIYQNGIISKVARVEHKHNGTYDVGVKFLTRKEKNLTHIYPKVHFEAKLPNE